jgi:hypothetical protein
VQGGVSVAGADFHARIEKEATGVLDPGRAAYSDTVALPDGTFLCLYERGTKRPYERLSLVRFALA